MPESIIKGRYSVQVPSDSDPVRQGAAAVRTAIAALPTPAGLVTADNSGATIGTLGNWQKISLTAYDRQSNNGDVASTAVTGGISILRAGYYDIRVNGSIAPASPVAGDRGMRFRVDGVVQSTIYTPTPTAQLPWFGSISRVYPITAGQLLTFEMFQNSGASVAVSLYVSVQRCDGAP